MSLQDIEARTRAYHEARELLQQRVAAMKEGLDALHKTHLPGVKRALARVAELDAEIKALIAQHPDLFVRPKTLVMHATKVGFAKGRGKTKIDKPEVVVARIKKMFPDQVHLLIHTEEKPNKEALMKLPAADLKKLGVEITQAGDEPVVQPVDTAVDKLVTALLKSATEDAQAEAEGA